MALDPRSLGFLFDLILSFFKQEFDCSDCGAFMTTFVVNNITLEYTDYAFPKLEEAFLKVPIREDSFEIPMCEKVTDMNAINFTMVPYHDNNAQQMILQFKSGNDRLCQLKSPWPIVDDNLPRAISVDAHLVHVDGVLSIKQSAKDTTFDHLVMASSLPSENFSPESELYLPFRDAIMMDHCSLEMISPRDGVLSASSIYSRKIELLKRKKKKLCLTGENGTRYSQVYDMYQMNAFLNFDYADDIQRLQKRYPDSQVLMVVRFNKRPKNPNGRATIDEREEYFNTCHYFWLAQEYVEVFCVMAILVLVLIGGLMAALTLFVMTLDNMVKEVRLLTGAEKDSFPILRSPNISIQTEAQSQAYTPAGGGQTLRERTFSRDTHDPTMIEREPIDDNATANEETDLKTSQFPGRR
ncbi:unnamed protein product [Bursaphelenchus xylophilus]|uniref:(pine wood nematode) hypothetical protein n=1 Tax=Bursaphelenchus xylophilus TaxID=6326 RepID=A0A7I8WYB7_BURXY|nr:unnamed protein product [Bursaphelenchus xylophilus]CAG9100823.1 unnamed protein product [Bursaphelenchus xylophilus]